MVASSQDAARQAAEAAFATQAQPICRAKMHIADLGPATEGAVTPARTTGELFADRGVHIDARCDPPPGTSHTASHEPGSIPTTPTER